MYNVPPYQQSFITQKVFGIFSSFFSDFNKIELSISFCQNIKAIDHTLGFLLPFLLLNLKNPKMNKNPNWKAILSQRSTLPKCNPHVKIQTFTISIIEVKICIDNCKNKVFIKQRLKKAWKSFLRLDASFSDDLKILLEV